MTLAATSETLSSGGNIATHTVGGKEHQVLMSAGADGHIIGSRPDFLLWFAPGTNAVNRILAELFNTGTVPIRIRGVWIMPDMSAVTGAPLTWAIQRSTAVGTGGTAVAPAKMDNGDGSTWPAAATARAGPTGGATAGTLLFNAYGHNEESQAPAAIIGLANQLPQLGDRMLEVVLRQNEGLMVKQTAGATVGATGCLMLATYDN